MKLPKDDGLSDSLMGDMGDPSSISNDPFSTEPMGDGADMSNEEPMGTDNDMNIDNEMSEEPIGDVDNMNSDPMGGDDMNDDPTDNDMSDEAPDDPGSSVGVDKKKNLQKLAGRLSNDIKDYNNDNEKKDTETNKYITNMVIGQTVKGMEENDIQDVVDKLMSGEKFDTPKINEPNNEKTSELDDEVNKEIDKQIGESKETINHLITVNEIFNDLKKFHEEEPIDTVPENDYNYNKKPFIPNNF